MYLPSTQQFQLSSTKCQKQLMIFPRPGLPVFISMDSITLHSFTPARNLTFILDPTGPRPYFSPSPLPAPLQSTAPLTWTSTTISGSVCTSPLTFWILFSILRSRIFRTHWKHTAYHITPRLKPSSSFHGSLPMIKLLNLAYKLWKIWLLPTFSASFPLLCPSLWYGSIPLPGILLHPNILPSLPHNGSWPIICSKTVSLSSCFHHFYSA